MPIDDIAVDEAGVATLQLLWYPGLSADLCKVMSGLDVNGEAVLAKVVGVPFAAAALRILEKDDLGWIRMGRRCGNEECRKCCKASKLFHFDLLTVRDNSDHTQDGH